MLPSPLQVGQRGIGARVPLLSTGRKRVSWKNERQSSTSSPSGMSEGKDPAHGNGR